MKTTLLKLSTMAMTLLSTGVGIDLQGRDALQQVQSFNNLPIALQSPGPHSSKVVEPLPSTVYSAFDPLIIPGRSVGPVTADTSHDDLVKIFDPARLTDVEAPMGEGFVRPGTRVELRENRSFTIVWADADRTQVAEVRDIGSDWRTPEGIRPGHIYRGTGSGPGSLSAIRVCLGLRGNR